jgi:protein subunit release factor A
MKSSSRLRVPMQKHIHHGERSRRIRTYHFGLNLVMDHRTGQRVPLHAILAGHLELLTYDEASHA